MTATFCRQWEEILSSEHPYRSTLEEHLATCSTCTRALAGVSVLTARLASSCEAAPRVGLSADRIGPILTEQRRRDVAFGAFAVLQFAAMQLAGGAFGSPVGNRALGLVAVTAAAVVGVRWLQRRALLRSFGTETLAGHLRVTTRAAERRIAWVAVLSLGLALLFLGLIPFSVENPVAIVPWLAGPVPRLSAMAIGPALFAVYTWFVVRPRAVAIRREVEA